MAPRNLLSDIAGKDVLCLACGGGQQSAVFGLLGASVTVVEISRGQLAADRTAATHYGYPVTLLHADMRDLSMLTDASFDLVYNTALCYVPDICRVYSESARVLRPGGKYRTDFWQPAVDFVQWDGEAYQVARPYHEQVLRREDGAIEFRHYMDDIFEGLLQAGLSIEQVKDLSRDRAPDPRATPGTWRHERFYVGGQFVVVASK
jgi:ubiquinone/menaquinone biosynthesis C-methylase UbiE